MVTHSFFCLFGNHIGQSGFPASGVGPTGSWKNTRSLDTVCFEQRALGRNMPPWAHDLFEDVRAACGPLKGRFFVNVLPGCPGQTGPLECVLPVPFHVFLRLCSLRCLARLSVIFCFFGLDAPETLWCLTGKFHFPGFFPGNRA